MTLTLRFLAFIALAALGFFSIYAVMFGALQFGLIAALPADEYLYNFRLFYFGGGMMAFILGCGLGVISFFTRDRISTAFLSLPLAVPALYSIVVLTYFTTISG